jgi:hypothetical protein
MSFHLVEFAQPIIRIVNTRFEDGGGTGNLESADHGGTPLDGVSLSFDGNRVGGAHGGNAFVGVIQEDGEDFLQTVRIDGTTEPLEDIGIEHGIFFGVMRGRGLDSHRATRKRRAQAVGRERLLEDSVVAVDVGRRRRAHGKKESAGRGAAQGAGKIGAAEARHTEVGKDAVGGIGGGQIDGLGAAFGLENNTAFRLEQDRGDRKTHGVVVDGQDAARWGRRPGKHVGDDFTHGRRRIHAGFTRVFSMQVTRG